MGNDDNSQIYEKYSTSSDSTLSSARKEELSPWVTRDHLDESRRFLNKGGPSPHLMKDGLNKSQQFINSDGSPSQVVKDELDDGQRFIYTGGSIKQVMENTLDDGQRFIYASAIAYLTSFQTRYLRGRHPYPKWKNGVKKLKTTSKISKEQDVSQNESRQPNQASTAATRAMDLVDATRGSVFESENNTVARPNTTGDVMRTAVADTMVTKAVTVTEVTGATTIITSENEGDLTNVQNTYGHGSEQNKQSENSSTLHGKAENSIAKVTVAEDNTSWTESESGKNSIHTRDISEQGSTQSQESEKESLLANKAANVALTNSTTVAPVDPIDHDNGTTSAGRKDSKNSHENRKPWQQVANMVCCQDCLFFERRRSKLWQRLLLSDSHQKAMSLLYPVHSTMVAPSVLDDLLALDGQGKSPTKSQLLSSSDVATQKRNICPVVLENENMKELTNILSGFTATGQATTNESESLFVFLLRDYLVSSLDDAVYDARDRAILFDLACAVTSLSRHSLSNASEPKTRTALSRSEKLSHVFWDPALLLAVVENQVAVQIKEAKEESEQDRKRKQQYENSQKYRKWWYFGGAVLGGTIIGLTGGLAAPVIGAYAAGLLGSGAVSTGLFLTTAGGQALVGTLFGAYGANAIYKKTSDRYAQLEELEFRPLRGQGQLTVQACVSGWLTKAMNDPGRPWDGLKQLGEQLVMVFDTKRLIALGDALVDIVKKEALGYAVSRVLAQTFLAGIMAAVATPVLLMKLSQAINNPWSNAMNSVENASDVLAEALALRSVGHRPLDLYGYSLGAAVIFKALVKLHDRYHDDTCEESDAGLGSGSGSESGSGSSHGTPTSARRVGRCCRGIVCNVFLMGAPVTNADIEAWGKVRLLTSGHIYNGYCGQDWLLRMMCQVMGATFDLAGLHPNSTYGVSNVDLKGLVNGHLDYVTKMSHVLRFLGLSEIDSAGMESESDVIIMENRDSQSIIEATMQHGALIMTGKEKAPQVETDVSPLSSSSSSESTEKKIVDESDCKVRVSSGTLSPVVEVMCFDDLTSSSSSDRNFGFDEIDGENMKATSESDSTMNARGVVGTLERQSSSTRYGSTGKPTSSSSLSPDVDVMSFNDGITSE